MFQNLFISYLSSAGRDNNSVLMKKWIAPKYNFDIRILFSKY